MTTSKLPQVNEAAPRRRRNVTAKPAAEKKTKAPVTRKKAEPKKAPPSQEQMDIVMRDQAERARQAREAALRDTPSVETVDAGQERSVEVPTAVTAEYGVPQPTVVNNVYQHVADAAAPALDTAQLIVNQELVDVLKAVKGTSLGDFEKFLHELYPLMKLWSGALTEGAARRHALSIMLLIKERF